MCGERDNTHVQPTLTRKQKEEEADSIALKNNVSNGDSKAEVAIGNLLI